MTLLLWVAAGWLAAAIAVTAIFLAARRSALIYNWLFGDVSRKVSAPAPRAIPKASNDGSFKLAA